METIEIKKKILHAIETKVEISPQEIELDYQGFGEMVEEMQTEGYIKDAMIVHGGKEHNISGVVLIYAFVTAKGYDLLK